MGIYMLRIADWTPPRLNQVIGRSWYVANKLKKQATELLAFMARQQGVPNASGRRRVSLTVTLAGRMRQPDRDSYDKLLLDSLVRSGLLLDDGARGVAGRMEVEFERGDRALTEIIFEDVA